MGHGAQDQQGCQPQSQPAGSGHQGLVQGQGLIQGNGWAQPVLEARQAKGRGDLRPVQWSRAARSSAQKAAAAVAVAGAGSWGEAAAAAAITFTKALPTMAPSAPQSLTWRA